MNNPKPKTYQQVRCIYGEAKRCGLDNDALHELVFDVTAVSSLSILTYAQAQKVIERLKGRSFAPRRTLQYRRQRAGIKQVVQESQLRLIAELAAQRHWTVDTLSKFCERQCKHPRPRTTDDANKVIEALKSMNKREGLWAA